MCHITAYYKHIWSSWHIIIVLMYNLYQLMFKLVHVQVQICLTQFVFGANSIEHEILT